MPTGQGSSKKVDRFGPIPGPRGRLAMLPLCPAGSASRCLTPASRRSSLPGNPRAGSGCTLRSLSEKCCKTLICHLNLSLKSHAGSEVGFQTDY